jgi:hypothetical protein
MCIEYLFGIGKIYPKTFISDFMMFDKELRDKIWKVYNCDAKSIFEQINHLISEQFLFCDYEPYGSLVYKYFPNSYTFLDIKTKLFGKFNEDWSKEEIEKLIDENKHYNLITTHTWI